MTSELFGHVRGAFTGAQASRRGLFELADGGTLFLDEIGEAPLPLQAMLLRALESREIWPVGGSEPRQVDCRIIAATNRDLLAEAQNNTFRLDLYYRLVVAPIFIPPLRDRPQDVRGLGAPMLEAAARRMGRVLPRVTDAAWSALENHTWPGNVRELSNVMERLVIYHSGKEVDVEDLNLPSQARVSEPPPPSFATGAAGFASSQRVLAAVGNVPSSGNVRISGLWSAGRGTSPRSFPAASPSDSQTITLRVPDTGTTFDDLEREILVQILQRAEGNQSRAARSLGLSESTLRSRLKRLGLKD
ncbi:MAG: sigma 54-interacting transcriptional regulator, partial [Polyangiaceae bacterium]